MPASAGALALDGARLVLTTDAAPTGAVQQHAIDASTGALTIASAVVLSVIVALILTPALCATMLKPVAKGHYEKKRGFFG